MQLGWGQSETTKAFNAWYQDTRGLSDNRPTYTPPPFPKDGTLVRAKVIEVKHPSFDSPSLIGDKSKATLTVERGTIPMHPKVTRIIMGFDRYNGRSLLEVGDNCSLRFTKEGKLFDYDVFDYRRDRTHGAR